MEKLDAVIAALGGLVVVAAAVLVGTQGVSAGFQVAFVEVEQGAGEGNRQHVGEAFFLDEYAIVVEEPLTARVNVSASASFLPMTQGQAGNLRGVLRAPNGSEYAAETTWTGSPGAPARGTVAFDVPALARPSPVLVDARDAEGAEARAAGTVPQSSAVGTWTLQVRFVSGPVPVNSATSSWEGRLHVWSPEATPVGSFGK